MFRVGKILRCSYNAATSRGLMEISVEPYASSIIPSRWLRCGQQSSKPGTPTLYQIKAVDRCPPFIRVAKLSTLPLSAHVDNRGCQSSSRATYARALNSNWLIKNASKPQHNAFPAFSSVSTLRRAYSSDARAKPAGLQNDVSNVSSTEASNVGTTDAEGDTWINMLEHTRQSAVDATTAAGKKVKELTDAVAPHVQQLYDTHPNLEKVIVPLGGTLFGTVLAWFVMPIIFRRLHKYTTESPLTVLLGNSTKKEVPYETSLWSALEDPAKYLITFMAFSEMAAIIVPSISDYLPQAWRGAFVLSFVWFLHRWKTNFIAGAMANQAALGIDRDRLSAFDKVSSLGLIALGVMGLAEACGVAVQSILTVGGVGGVATAFAARDILGNMLSGFSLQFSRPFSVGDYIKAGSIEGQVTEIGLISTSLINLEKLPVIVPNSLFSSQMIVNKSRAQWRASVTKIPVRIEDIEKIPAITGEIKAMLRSNPKVFLEKDAPYCYLSRLESSFGELTIGCNLKSMRKDEWFSTEQDILLQAARVIRQHGAELGSTTQRC